MASGSPPKQSRHRGHHDGPEAQQARLIDGFNRRQPLIALGLQGKVDHHDCILLHDADEQDDADQGDDAQFGSGKEQSQNRARRPAGGNGGKNGKRMDQALVKNAEHDVNRHQRREDQILLILERVLKGLRRALEGGMDGAAACPSRAAAFSRAVTASPRATLGARLKVSVTAGYCPWWFTCREVRCCSK